MRLPRWLLALVLLPALPALGQDDDRLIASVDRETIRENESFRYTLRAEGQLSGRPDLSALALDFDVLESWRSSSMQLRNGRMTQVAEWVVSLMPKTTGTFELPPVELGGALSNALTVEILPADEGGPDAPADVFLEVELDRESGYVQAQVIFTLRLYVGVGTGRQTLTAPLIEGSEAIVEKLGSDREFQTAIDNRVYNVRERNYAIFPQAPGTLSIGPAVYEAMIMPRNGPARQQRLRSDVVELEVRPAVPPPPEHPQAVWLPARQIEFAETFNDGGALFEQGVPRTRTVTVTADGVLETQLPELELGATPGLRQYPDQPELEHEITADGIRARRTERFAVIAQQTGPLELPPVELPWWNVDAERWEVARIDSRRIDVLPGEAPEPDAAEAAAGSGPPLQAAPSPGWWPWLAGAVALGWLATVLAWLYSAGRLRRRPVPRPAARPPSARALLKQLAAACRVSDAGRTRGLLLDWARLQFPDGPPGNLGALAARVSGPLAAEIRALEAALYGPNPADWEGRRLAELLRQTQSVGHSAVSGDEDPLVPLYR